MAGTGAKGQKGWRIRHLPAPILLELESHGRLSDEKQCNRHGSPGGSASPLHGPGRRVGSLVSGKAVGVPVTWTARTRLLQKLASRGAPIDAPSLAECARQACGLHSGNLLRGAVFEQLRSACPEATPRRGVVFEPCSSRNPQKYFRSKWPNRGACGLRACRRTRTLHPRGQCWNMRGHLWPAPRQRIPRTTPKHRALSKSEHVERRLLAPARRGTSGRPRATPRST